MIDFNNIEKLTSVGRYQVDTPIKHLDEKIKDWVDNLGLDFDVDFQRGHVWTEEQQISFVEFILKGGTTTPIYFNHPNWMNSFEGDFVIVDGKQRLTAILKFLADDLKAFGSKLSDFENLYLNTFDIKININDLKTKKEVYNWYLEINSGGTPHTEDELQKVRNLLKD